MVSPVEIYKYLPKTNCRKCGIPSCMGFAVKLIKQEKFIDDCPVLKEAKYIRNSMKLKEVLAPILQTTETQLVIHEDKCNGCGDCVIACPVNVSFSLDASGGKGPETEDVIIKMEDGKVKVVNLQACRRFEGDFETRPCRVCIDACPLKAIEFV
jgi:4Fe-4S ferredoxin